MTVEAIKMQRQCDGRCLKGGFCHVFFNLHSKHGKEDEDGMEKELEWHCLHSELTDRRPKRPTDNGTERETYLMAGLILHLAIVKCMLK